MLIIEMLERLELIRSGCVGGDILDSKNIASSDDDQQTLAQEAALPVMVHCRASA